MRRPRYCVWELTLACNLRCGHCGSRAGRPRPDELDTEESLDLVRSLSRLGCQVVTLSGGEPTLRRDWYTIASEIRQRGMIPNMVTNGVGVTAEVAARMKRAGLANVAVSLDGPRQIHDELRGPGSFERSARGLRLLREAGLHTTVMTTINAANLTRLEELHDVAVELGAARWRSQLGKPMGAMDDRHDLVIAPRDLLELMPKLYALHRRGQLEVSIGDSLGFFGPYDSALRAVSWDGKSQRWGGCQAGLQAVGIEADGGVKGCLSMQAFAGGDDPFLEGNVRTRALESIWLDPDSFSYNRSFCADSLEGFCRRCAHALRCRGGARCVAAAVTGGLGEDPYCYHRVASLYAPGPSERLRRQIATAASIFSLLGSGCGGYAVDAQPKGGGVADQAQCEEVCCDCDPPPPTEIMEACCYDAVARYGVAIPEEDATENDTQPGPPADECADCDYGMPPPPPEVCLQVAEICADFECEPSCDDAASGEPDWAGDYGVPPPLPAECDICCQPAVSLDYAVAPAYGISEYGVEPPSGGRISVSRLSHELVLEAQVVTEEWAERPSHEGQPFPRDLALATEAADAQLVYQGLEPIAHDDTCGYCGQHAGCQCRPAVGICEGEAPAVLVSPPLFGLINTVEPVAPVVLDLLSRQVLVAPTPLLSVVSWSELYQLDELALACLEAERVVATWRRDDFEQPGAIELGRFARDQVSWVQASALAATPAAFIMTSAGELTLHSIAPDGQVEVRAVPRPISSIQDGARAFSAVPGSQAMASAPLEGGLVAIGITGPETRAGLDGLGDRIIDTPAPAAARRLALFTVGCGINLPPRR